MLKPWLELARISNLPTAWTNVLAGWLLAGGHIRDHRLLWLLLGASLLYSGGMILNDAADAGWDRENRQERPIPRGDISVGTAWAGGLLMMIAGGGFMQPLGGANGLLVTALAACILAYDLYHKQWAGSVIVMGACRTLLYLVAGSAVKGSVSLEWSTELFAAAFAMGLYIIGISVWARRESFTRPARGTGALALACLLAPLAAPLVAALVYSFVHEGLYVDVAAIIVVRRFGRAYIGGFFVLAVALVVVVRVAAKIMRTPPPANIGRGVGILLAGIVVVDGLAVASLGGIVEGCAMAALMPFLRLWQRKIAAT